MSDLPLEYARCYDPECPLWQTGECARADTPDQSPDRIWLRSYRRDGAKSCEKKIILPGIPARGTK